MTASPAAASWIAHSHCGYCGQPFGETSTWPRTCNHCGNTSFRNPLPVCVLLIPVGHGILTVRRGIPPKQGELALPGGFVEWGESWQAAGAREAREEAGVAIAPASIHPIDVFSAPDGTLIIVGQTASIVEADLAPFVPTLEATERQIITQPRDLAWPLHTEAVHRYFSDHARP